MAESSVLPSVLDIATGGLGSVAKSAARQEDAKPAPAPAADQALRDPDTGLVAVTNPDGTTDFVRHEDAPSALAQGSRPATEAEYYAAKTGTLGTLASGGVGALQGLTSEFAAPGAVAAARALGDESDVAHARRTFRVAQEMHPGAYIGGEVVGSLAQALVGGAPEGAAVTGESMLARGLSRAAAAAPRAALEGGIFGVGHQLTEDALGDHEVTAQHLLASADGGAVFGAILGGGFAAGGGAMGDAIARLRGGSPAADAAASTKSGALGWLRGEAEEQAFKATGAKTAAVERLGRNAEEQSTEVRRLGRRLLDEGIVGPTTSKGEMAERVEQKLEQAGSDLAAMRKPLDKATVRPEMANIIARADAEILQPLTGRTRAELNAGMTPDAGSLFGDVEAKPAQDALERFINRTKDNPSFEKLHDLRVDLDAVLKKSYARGPGPIPPGEEGLRTLRSIVEDEYTRAGEAAAKEIGGTFESKYQLAKGLYADLKTVQGILAKEVPREAANRAVSLTDTIAGAGGLSTAAAAIMAGHPIGALAAAAPLVNKAIRTYGNQVAAHVLDKAAQLQAIQRVSQRIDRQVSEGVTGFLKGGAKGAATTTKTKVTAQTAQELRAAVANPQAFRAHVEDVIAGSGLNDSAPNVSRALATSVMRAASYVASKAPADPPRQGLAFGPTPPRPIGATDMQRFQDIVDTVNDPMSVVNDLKKGRLNRDKIEALKNVYPAIYDKVRAEVAGQAIEMKPLLTTQQEIALSVLTGEPINAQMRPENIRGFSQAFAKSEDTKGQPQQQGAPLGPQRPLQKQGGALASGMDRIEGGDARS